MAYPQLGRTSGIGDFMKKTVRGGSSDDNLFRVVFTTSGTVGEMTVTCDKSRSEILSALGSGAEITVYLVSPETNGVEYLSDVSYSYANEILAFFGVSMLGGTNVVVSLVFTSDTEVEMTVREIASLPPVTSDDNGEVLGVVDGQWGKVDKSVFVAHFSAEIDEQTVQPTNISCDVSRTDILNAFNAGRSVCAEVEIEGLGFIVLPTFGSKAENQMGFTGISFFMGTVCYFTIGFHPDQTLFAQIIPLVRQD